MSYVVTGEIFFMLYVQDGPKNGAILHFYKYLENYQR